jgi:hypothetical protein
LGAEVQRAVFDETVGAMNVADLELAEAVQDKSNLRVGLGDGKTQPVMDLRGWPSGCSAKFNKIALNHVDPFVFANCDLNQDGLQIWARGMDQSSELPTSSEG